MASNFPACFPEPPYLMYQLSDSNTCEVKYSIYTQLLSFPPSMWKPNARMKNYLYMRAENSTSTNIYPLLPIIGIT